MLLLRTARPLQLRHSALALSARGQYTPGGGIQNTTQVAKRREEMAIPFEEENPRDFTIFGNKKKPKTSVFHYTDRASGKGYSDYSSHIYVNRPYIWPPLRKLFNFNMCLALIGFVICFLDVDMLQDFVTNATKGMRAGTSDD
uniref:Deltameth_res domain-containing protein n=1 Tax=Steinernema glaseri TaxID=37863 RepID=A0A1I7ZUB9_9BILA